MSDKPNDYWVGGGRLLFAAFTAGTLVPAYGMEYFGNTPEVSLNQSAETLDHYGADDVTKVKDASMDLSRDTTGSFQTDNISKANLAKWWLGVQQDIVVGAATGLTQVETARRGDYYYLGKSTATPQGHPGLTNVVVTNSIGGTRSTGTLTFTANPAANDTVTVNSVVITFKASGAVGAQVNIGADAAATAQALKTYINANTGTVGVKAYGDAGVLTLRANVGGTGGNSYTLAKSATQPAVSGATMTGGSASIAALNNVDIDLSRGRVQVLHTAVDIFDGDILTFTFDQTAQTFSQVISGGSPIYGELRLEGVNRYTGGKRDFTWPYVKISPDGDLSLKGDDWMGVTFNLEILKLTGKERVYIHDIA